MLAVWCWLTCSWKVSSENCKVAGMEARGVLQGRKSCHSEKSVSKGIQINIKSRISEIKYKITCIYSRAFVCFLWAHPLRGRAVAVKGLRIHLKVFPLNQDCSAWCPFLRPFGPPGHSELFQSRQGQTTNCLQAVCPSQVQLHRPTPKTKRVQQRRRGRGQ